MATAIVSIAARNAGFEVPSIALLWTAVGAFVSLAALDVWLVRHPLDMLRRAGRPGQGFHALGFVADGCVLGVRIAGSETAPAPAALTIATIFLIVGWVLWLLILAAVAVEHGRDGGTQPRGEWLLTVVATEGLAILAVAVAGHQHLPALHAGAAAMWIAGGLAYAIVGVLLARRVAAWGLASLMLIVIATVDALRVVRLGVRFTPERWTMVFPLGMYSVASWMLGRSLGAGWLTELGRVWLAVAFAAWAAVAFGELRHLLAGARAIATRPQASWRERPGPPRAAG
jgi:tellurite resistance protein TehA-like permease